MWNKARACARESSGRIVADQPAGNAPEAPAPYLNEPDAGESGAFTLLDWSSFLRQSGQKHPFTSAGIGPCGNCAHQHSPSGLQVIGALHRTQRISTAAIISQWSRSKRRRTAARADALGNLWQTECLHGTVFCAARNALSFRALAKRPIAPVIAKRSIAGVAATPSPQAGPQKRPRRRFERLPAAVKTGHRD
jgi:hypothetical protein